MVEGTPLLREHTGQNLYPGFESLRLRQFSFFFRCIAIPPGLADKLASAGKHDSIRELENLTAPQRIPFHLGCR